MTDELNTEIIHRGVRRFAWRVLSVDVVVAQGEEQTVTLARTRSLKASAKFRARNWGNLNAALSSKPLC